MSAKRVVAHCVRTWLRFGSNWIYPQVGGLRRYRPIVLCKNTVNLSHFPLDAAGGKIITAYSNPLQHLYQKLARKYWAKHYPAYFKALAHIRPSLIHSHFAAHGYEDLPLARRLSSPYVISTYGADIWKLGAREEWRVKYRQLFAEASALLAEGTAMKRKMVELGCDEAKVRVLRLGVDLEKIRFLPRAPEANGTVRCLMAGRAVEKKGMRYGLLAFANAAQKFNNLRLSIIVVGDSKRKRAHIEELKRLATDRGVADRVTWYGPQPYDAYLKITEQAHIFMAPSVLAQDGDAEGGCPVTVIELSAAGMPILGTTHCDIPEVVIDGKTGLLAAEKDADGLTRRLEHLLSHPETWAAMGRAGRAHIEAEHNARIQPARLEEIYDTLC